VHYRELPTPALAIDLDILERNINRMAAYCKTHGLRLRPHTKTHKTPQIARMQIKSGATGLTVAKTGEAEVMAFAGFDDILVAFPVFGYETVRRLAKLAINHRVLVSVDDEITVQALSRALQEQKEDATLDILVEFDAGFGRCGLAPGSALVNLARKIEKMPRLRFRGLMTFFGSIWGTEDERKQEVRRVAERVELAVEAFRQCHIPLEIVSGGSTPSATFAHEIPGLTEIRPGTYVFNDLNMFYQGVCGLEDCAARIVTTVVSTAVPGRAIIDAGSKALSSESLAAGTKTGYGYLMEAPDAQLFALSEEHGHLDITKSTRRFRVGDVFTVIPNHVCPCVNMHDEVFLLRDGEVVGSWPVAARGKIR
jgi:D-serine deaminase-like pyridoxal phosphate-dependent protein